MSQLPMPMASTSSAMTSAEGEFERAGGAREFCRDREDRAATSQCGSVSPISVATKGRFQAVRKPGMGEGDGPGGVVEQSDTNFVAEGWLEFFEGGFEFFDEAGGGELGAENILRVLRPAIPEEDIEFVVDEAGEHAVAGGAHELAEFGFGGGDFGEGLHLISLLAFGGGRLQLLLRRHTA